METESEKHPKKATKGTKRRRKSVNNGPNASGSAMVTNDIAASQSSNAKPTRARSKSKKESKRNSSLDEGQSTRTPTDENGAKSLVSQNDTGVSNNVNMSQSNMSNQSSNSNALTQQYPQTPNGPPTTMSHQYRPYGNGGGEQNLGMDGNGPQASAATMNGPPQAYNADNYHANYSNYGSSNQYGSHSGKPGMRPQYPRPPSGSTPTLNQLLTRPSRYPQQSNYPNYPSAQMEYSDGNSLGSANSPYWPGTQTRPGQYAGNQEQQIGPEKHGMNMYGPQPAPQYPGHQQYSSSRGYPGPQRYPMPSTSSTQQYSQQQQPYPSGMAGPNSSHPYGTPGNRGHPPHSGAPPYSQSPYGHQQTSHNLDPYYGQQRPPPGYNLPGYQQPGPNDQAYHPHPGKPEASASHAQEQGMTGTKTPDSVSGTGNAYQQQSGYYMKSPGHVTPQPPRTPSSQTSAAQSPLTVPHPAISHLRGPSSAPGSPSPGVSNRNNPLSPTPVRPSTPHQQMGSMMKSPSSHSEHSQSPMPGYGHSRHMQQQQHPYSSQQGNPASGPQQSMMSPPHSMPYPQNQQGHYPPNHPGMGSQIMGPPSAATPGPPKPLSQPSTPGTPQSQGSYGSQQQSGYGMQYPGYGYGGPQPMMPGYPSQTPPVERRTSWQGQGQGQQQMTPQSPHQQMQPHGQSGQAMPVQSNTAGQYPGSAPYGDPHQPSQAVGSSNQYPVGHPQYGQSQYGQGQQLPSGIPASAQYPEAPGQATSSAASAANNSGAAAAAAAAMAAAAHSAKARSAYQKQAASNFPAASQSPAAASQQMQPSPQQRGLPFHPNYANVQTGPSGNHAMPPEGFPQQHPSSGYPPVTPGQQQQQQTPGRAQQHALQAGPMPHGAMHPQQNMQQPGMHHPHMQPQSGYPGYPMQHAGYGPGGSVPPGGSFMQPSSASYDSMSQGFEEPKPKASSSARSASQKLSALYEPEEPGRKEFIDRVLQYWEDKDLPLKHAPLMGRRTLDLFTLYQLVKKKGFMQEVTRAKEWADISTTMGLGNSSTSGFTLKKQYCKYLYGLECRFERGEQEPQEALARVIEANRKKKQAAEQQQAKAAEVQMEQRSDGGPPSAPQHPQSQQHPMQYGMQYPPGHYPHQQQHPGMPAQMQQPYGGLSPASQGHPGQPYQYPGAQGPHGQMTPYGPNQYPQQHPQYPQHPSRHMAPPHQPGYEQHAMQQPTGGSVPQPQVPTEQQNPYSQQPQHAAAPNVPQTQQDTKLDGNQVSGPVSQPEKTGLRKPSADIPTMAATNLDSANLELPPAAEQMDTTEKRVAAPAGEAGKPTSSAVQEPSAAESAIETASSAASTQSKESEKSEGVAVTTAAAAVSDELQIAPKVSSNVQTTSVITPSTNAPPATISTSTPGSVMSATDTSATLSQPAAVAPRMPAPAAPYRPNMMSPQHGTGQRHPTTMAGNFRPPNQPGQPPYYSGQPQHYPGPLGPQHYGGQDPYSRQPFSKPGHDMHRMVYQRVQPPGHYPYQSGSPAHVRQSSGPPHHHGQMMMPGAPPNRPLHHHQQPAPSQSPYRPVSSGSAHTHPQYSMPGPYPPHPSGYPTPPPGGNHYPGLKRPSSSSDSYAPPNKMLRPDIMHPSHYGPGYGRQVPQVQPVYGRAGPDSVPPGHHYPPGPPAHHQGGPRGSHPSLHPGVSASSNSHSMGTPHPTFPPHMRRPHSNMSPANPASVYPSGRPGTPNSGMKWRHPGMKLAEAHKSHGMHGESASKCLQGLSRGHSMSPHPLAGHPPRMRIPQPYQPASASHTNKTPHACRYHPSIKMENANTIFPHDSVEATHPRLIKFRLKTSRDVGVMEAWRVIMALRSGLLAESTWALNTLTVLLHDQRTVGQIVLSQLPGLLHSLVDHYRCCLKELFSLPEEVDSCCGTVEVGKVKTGPQVQEDKKLFDVVSKCQEDCSKALLSGKYCKYVAAPQNLRNPFSKMPVKLVMASDANIMDKSILWEEELKKCPTDDASHIVVSYNQTSSKSIFHDEMTRGDRDSYEDGVRAVEVSLEDILSVPSYIRCHEESDVIFEQELVDCKEKDSAKKEDGSEDKEEGTEEVVDMESGSKEDAEPSQQGEDLGQSDNPEIKEEQPASNTTAMDTSDETPENGMVENEKESTKTEKSNTEEKNPIQLQSKPDPDMAEMSEPFLEHKNLHVLTCLERYSQNCNVVLLEDEPAGCPGEDSVVMTRSGRFYGGSGATPLLSRAHGDRETELCSRVMCLSNLIRSLSCMAVNHSEICRHKGLIRALSGTLLLRHKHRTRPLEGFAAFSSQPEPGFDFLKPESSLCASEEKKECKFQADKKMDSTAEATDQQAVNGEPFTICEKSLDLPITVANSNSSEVGSPKLEDSEDSMDSKSSDSSVFKKPGLENGIDAVHKISACNGKETDCEQDTAVTEKNIQARKKNINDLCRKLRSSRNGGDLPKFTGDEQKENSITSNGKTKLIKIHETINNVRSKPPNVKSAIRLVNGPSTINRNDVLSAELGSEEDFALKLKNHRKLPTAEETSIRAMKTEERIDVPKVISADTQTKVVFEPKQTTNESASVEGEHEHNRTASLQTKREKRSRLLFSSTVSDPKDDDERKRTVYEDPWWWECAQQVREDSLVTLANLSTYMNLAELPDDDATLAILDSCLHWVVCPSAEAQDSFSTMGLRATLSPQNLVIEILTKLSMKEGNSDLILAMRPYSRLEKLFSKLVTMVGNRKDQTLREFSIVLLSNLSAAECTAARAIALQKGAVSNLIGFLEECEDTGLNNRRMFPAGQERINCGTIPYMMERCAFTLLTLAKISENRPLFLKHQLRLLSLSMSSLLGRIVPSLLSSLSSTLFELNDESPGR